MDEIIVQLQDIVTTIEGKYHDELQHLDYANSGHTGFASSAQLTAEQNARIAADTELGDDLSEEVERAEAKETELQNDINTRAKITETANKVTLELNTSDYKLLAKLFDKNNNLISTSNVIDLPIESMIVSASYDSATKSLILVLQNGQTITVPIGDLITGLATTEQLNAGLATKQDTLVSGINIKTINNQSILGSGNIDVGGQGSGVTSIGGQTGAITLGDGLSMSGTKLCVGMSYTEITEGE